MKKSFPMDFSTLQESSQEPTGIVVESIFENLPNLSRMDFSTLQESDEELSGIVVESIFAGCEDRPRIAVKRAGDAFEATSIRNDTYNLSRHKRQKGNKYLNRKGEEVSYTVNETKQSKNVKKSLKKAKLILKGNFTNRKDDFIALTCENGTDDYKQVNKDFRLFMNRLRYYYSERNKNERAQRLPKYDFGFVKIMDVHETGDLHIHMLLKDENGKTLRMNQATIERLWGHGLVEKQKIYDINGLAKYLCELNIRTKTGGKRADRVQLYPKGMGLYSKSKNIKGVEKVGKLYSIAEVKKEVAENDGKTYDFNIIAGNEGKVVNTIHKFEWTQKAPARPDQEDLSLIMQRVDEIHEKLLTCNLKSYLKAKCHHEIRDIRKKINYGNVAGLDISSIICQLDEMEFLLEGKG